MNDISLITITLLVSFIAGGGFLIHTIVDQSLFDESEQRDKIRIRTNDRRER